MDEAFTKAKKFFEEQWDNEDMKIHAACVGDCCNNMIKNTTLNPDVFTIAGWIHDIGRKDDKDRHHIIGLDYLEKFLTQYPEYTNLKKEISDCILNHRRSQTPETIYGRIMQVADKLSLNHKDWIEYAKKYK